MRLLAALAGFLFQSCSGKYLQSSLLFGDPRNGEEDHRWTYVTKFGVYIGSGPYGMRIRLENHDDEPLPSDLNITGEVHLDDEWDATEKLPECRRASNARTTFDITLHTTGAWSEWFNGSLNQGVRRHVWYIALSECKQSLPDKAQVRIGVEFHAQQPNGSEFSIEHYGTDVVAMVKVVLGCFLFAWYAHACARVRRSAGKLHPMIVLLTVAAACQYFAYIFHWWHLSTYRADGRGVRFCDMLGEICAMLSQMLFSFLGIFLAKGYSILPSAQIRMEVVMPTFVLIAAVHVVIVGVAKLRDDASFRFHENDGVCGVLLVVLRLALYAWFWVSMWTSYSGASHKLRPFLARFSLATSLNYLAYPLLFLVAKVFAPYLRHKFMLIGIFILQAGSIVLYTQMFLTRGLYFEVSCLGANLLPTPKGSRKERELFKGDGRNSSPNVWEKTQ